MPSVHPVQAAALLSLTLCATAHGQGLGTDTAAPGPTATTAPAPTGATASTTPKAPALPAVTVTGQGGTGLAGFDAPAARTPLSTTLVTESERRDRGAHRLADVTSLDAGVSDSYNTTGYWDYLRVRGFTLDNRFNYRRDGLPISAETALPLENKERVEVLKGLAGIQAGTSAPGGLVNLEVKRPDVNRRSAFIEWMQDGTVSTAVDVSQRFGQGDEAGLRVNLGHAEIDPAVRAAKGRRQVAAVAADFRPDRDTLFEAELEWSHQSQPSVPGFSLLGDRVPAPVDPRINLNNQPWSLPVVMDGTTASFRWTQRVSPDWRFVVHAATQRLRTDDRIAFPFGCYDAAADTYYADRYCPDGSFDLYDFRSENERRRTDALDIGARGRMEIAGTRHALQAGVLRSSYTQRMQLQAYNYAGTGQVDGSAVTPAAPTAADQNTQRDERSTEFYLRDHATLAPGWSAWAGLRHVRLDRAAVRTNGSRATRYDESFTTPWFALGVDVAPGHLVYASWGRGAESEVAPNRARYANAGEALGPLKSRQLELGWKGQVALREQGRLALQAVAFDLRRPVSASLDVRPGGCGSDTPPGGCVLAFDGDARHRGIELAAQWDGQAWQAGGSMMLLQARREGSADASVNGRRPPNVPERSAKAFLTWRANADWSITNALVHEGDRTLLPNDENVRIPSWTRWDVAAVLRHRDGAGRRWTWRAGIDNVTDTRAWREAPYQFDHVYLFPLAARTARISLQWDLQ
jgi:iron complex outermembrane receptor protein